jgi:hypothetical protein
VYSEFEVVWRMNKNYTNKRAGEIIDIILFTALALIIYLVFFVPQPSSLPVASPTANTLTFVGYEELPEPIQTPYKGNDFIPYIDKNIDLRIYPRANYRIYAMVMSKRGYSWEWDSKLVPYDLALAWNDLMLPENVRTISYSQGNRWYTFRLKPDCRLSVSYIARHSANTHMIPANANLKKALDVIKKGDKVYFEGYLVNIKGKVNNREAWRNSSLSRNDTGDGACELFYITMAVVDGVIYQ